MFFSFFRFSFIFMNMQIELFIYLTTGKKKQVSKLNFDTMFSALG